MSSQLEFGRSVARGDGLIDLNQCVVTVVEFTLGSSKDSCFMP